MVRLWVTEEREIFIESLGREAIKQKHNHYENWWAVYAPWRKIRQTLCQDQYEMGPMYHNLTNIWMPFWIQLTLIPSLKNRWFFYAPESTWLHKVWANHQLCILTLDIIHSPCKNTRNNYYIHEQNLSLLVLLHSRRTIVLRIRKFRDVPPMIQKIKNDMIIGKCNTN